MISVLCRSDVPNITGAVEAAARFFWRAGVFVGAFVAVSFVCAPSSWAAAGPICLEGPLGADPGLCLSNGGTHVPGTACQASGFCE